MKLADEFQEFEPAEFLIDERTVRDETGDRFGLFRLPFHVVAAQENLAGCGLEDSHHDTNGGCFAGAIGSKKAEDFALAELPGSTNPRPRAGRSVWRGSPV